jgi:hypothetical protein
MRATFTGPASVSRRVPTSGGKRNEIVHFVYATANAAALFTTLLRFAGTGRRASIDRLRGKCVKRSVRSRRTREEPIVIEGVDDGASLGPAGP